MRRVASRSSPGRVTIERRSKIPVYVGGALLYVVSTGIGFVLWKTQSGSCACPTCEELSANDLKVAVDNNAKTYDASIEMVEYLSVDALRRKLITRNINENDRVLEVAVGTGRNFSHYPDTCVLTAVDSSEAMLAQAKGKAHHVRDVRTTICDAHELSRVFPFETFDVVVDTFGLCSFSDPVLALKQMSSVCKRNGRILLLEHGRSSRALPGSLSRLFGGEWLSNVLDFYAERHARRWGCWWNRDIMGLIEEAGLKVCRIETSQMGTVYSVICRPIGHGDNDPE